MHWANRWPRKCGRGGFGEEGFPERAWKEILLFASPNFL